MPTPRSWDRRWVTQASLLPVGQSMHMGQTSSATAYYCIWSLGFLFSQCLHHSSPPRQHVMQAVAGTHHTRTESLALVKGVYSKGSQILDVTLIWVEYSQSPSLDWLHMSSWPFVRGLWHTGHAYSSTERVIAEYIRKMPWFATPVPFEESEGTGAGSLCCGDNLHAGPSWGC